MFAYIFIVYILQENDSCLFKIFIHFFNLTCAKKHSIINHCIMPFHIHQNISFNSFHKGTKVPLRIGSIVGHKCLTMICPFISRAFYKYWLVQSRFDNQISCLFTFQKTAAVCLHFQKNNWFLFLKIVCLFFIFYK